MRRALIFALLTVIGCGEGVLDLTPRRGLDAGSIADALPPGCVADVQDPSDAHECGSCHHVGQVAGGFRFQPRARDEARLRANYEAVLARIEPGGRIAMEPRRDATLG